MRACSPQDMVERVQQARASAAIDRATPASHFWTQDAPRPNKGPLKARHPYTAIEYQQYSDSQTRMNGEILGSLLRRDPSPAPSRVGERGASLLAHDPGASGYNPPQARRMRSPSPQLQGRGSNVYTTTNSIETMLENGRRARRAAPSRGADAGYELCPSCVCESKTFRARQMRRLLKHYPETARCRPAGLLTSERADLRAGRGSARACRSPATEMPARLLYNDTSNSERVFSLLQMTQDGRIAKGDARHDKGKLCCGLPQRESNVRPEP